MPTIVDLLPSGRFLMEEFYYAGGLPAVIRRMGDGNLLPNPDALTVNGKSLWENCKDAPIYDDEVVRTLDNPLLKSAGIWCDDTQAPPDSTNTRPRYTLMVPSVTTMGARSR